ncbi:histone acetylation protein-domain-containing protein [Zychaea mexicana]|uniref:histone acetylation protein-domain-containing protein n=1 Tax=Zychaea mexicana TaxID=64656 RepID=UPI0022FF2824|nr:histone acetylation protein-domain-containing protein [Zychaea mexicana]KAI9498881.1 histone acetylation protein-domain-containing protein [Zychaea mexicana]
MPTRTFSQQLQLLLEPLPSGTQFNVYDVRTQPTPCQLFRDEKTTSQHHLILVTGTTSIKEEADSANDVHHQDLQRQEQGEKQQQLVCGIEADEFETVHSNGVIEKTVYIGKVDTTGAFKGIVSKVVRAYIKSVSPCTVHVFARSQRQYLFHQSANNNDKQVLPDRDLLRWWYKLLTVSLEQTKQEQKPTKNTTTTTTAKSGLFGSWWKWMTSGSKNSNNASASVMRKQRVGWLSIPSIDDEQSANYEIGRKKDASSSSLWKYGYPYDPEAEAAEVLPRFEDDAKSRLLKSFKGNDDDDKMTVKDFWATLGITEECGHHLTGFFVVQLDDESDNTVEKEGCKEITRDRYTLLWNHFMNLNFEDVASNKKSTEKFIAKWKAMDLDECTVIHTNGPARPVTTIGETTTAASSSAAPTTEPKHINVLPTLSIKRRNPPSNEKVNVLSSTSIRRKRTLKETGGESDKAQILTDNNAATPIEQSKKSRTS